MEFLRNLLQQSLGILIEGGFVVVLVIILNIVVKQFVKNIYKQTLKRDGRFLKPDFVTRMLRPLRMMIWLVGLSYLAYIFVVRLQMQNDFETSFRQFRNIVIIFCSTWLCFEAKKQLLFSLTNRATHLGKSPDKSKINLISKLISFTIILVAGLIILDTLGVHIGALLAIGGVGGITIGFAAKDVFSNFFGGFMVHITKPFTVGDEIHTLDEKVFGTVENIGFYLTKVRGLDKKPFYVPNSYFTSQIFVNSSRKTNRMIKKTVGIRYEDFELLVPIIEDIRAYLKNNPEIDQKLFQAVDFKEFEDSSLEILIHCFTKATAYVKWLQVQQDVLIAIGEIIDKHGAEIAFPTSTLHFNPGNFNEN